MSQPRIGYHRVNAGLTTPEVRRYVRERDSKRCVECGRTKNLSLHHVRPISAGGSAMDPSNIVTLCESCHAAKHPTGSRQ